MNTTSTREVQVSLTLLLKFPTAHEALCRTDEIIAMFPEDTRSDINMRTIDRITPAQLEARIVAMTQAEPELPVNAKPPRGRAKKETIPADVTPGDAAQAETVPETIGGDPVAVAGDAPFAVATGGIETPVDATGSGVSGQVPGGASTDSDGGSTATAPVPSDDELRAAVKVAMTAAPANRAKVAALLKQTGVEAISHVPDGARPTFLAAIVALTAE